MTKKLLIIFVLTFIFLFISPVGPLQAQLKADEIIERSIMAQGGQEALEKIKDTVATLYLKIHTPQGELLAERKVYSKTEPFKIRIEQNILGNQLIIGFDGEKTWMQQMGKTILAPEVIHNSMKASAGRENILLKYKQKGGKAEYLGEKQVEDKRCYQVKIVGPEISETSYYFEAETFLPIKMEFEAPDEFGKIARTETVSSDFRQVENIVVPWKTIILVNGRKTMEITIQEIKYNQGLEDALFTPPEK